MDKTTLGNRMKRYESTSQTHLSIRTPVIIRIDGKAFHTFTRGMERPFDQNLMNCMAYTTFHLVNTIEGCVFGYTQSDEISLLLIDYQNINTQAWFDYKVQKLCSVSASIATAHFNREYQNAFKDEKRFATFDARAFNLPKEEVVNYFIWRQQDMTRNSVQMLGRSKFSQKQLHKKSCSDIQEMLFSEHKINWNDLETSKKRGTAILSAPYNGVDKETPIFSQDRDYIQNIVDCKGNEDD